VVPGSQRPVGPKLRLRAAVAAEHHPLLYQPLAAVQTTVPRGGLLAPLIRGGFAGAAATQPGMWPRRRERLPGRSDLVDAECWKRPRDAWYKSRFLWWL